MRLGEIIQLDITDIKTDEGVLYFDVNDDGEKSLKNASSRRKVPVHPTLIELGFNYYVKASKKAGHQRVFEEAPVTKAGNISDITSKKFGRYIESIGIKHDKLTFHSLRHTFIDYASKQAKLSDHVIKPLVGHADNSITHGTYGSKLSVPELYEAIEKIQYPILLKP